MDHIIHIFSLVLDNMRVNSIVKIININIIHFSDTIYEYDLSSISLKCINSDNFSYISLSLLYLYLFLYLYSIFLINGPLVIVLFIHY